MRELLQNNPYAQHFIECRTYDDIIQFWRGMGFLDNIEDRNVQISISVSCHKLAYKIYASEEIEGYRPLETIGFPILRCVILNGYKNNIEDDDLDLLYAIWENDKIEKIIQESNVTNEHDNDIIDKVKGLSFLELFTIDEDKYPISNMGYDAEAILTWHLSHYYGNKLKQNDENII